MKNIHILPTDKPSRLSILNSGKLDFSPEIMSSSNSKPQHIYITSDEEVKEGDYCISHLNIIDEGKIHNSQTVFNPKTKENLILLKSCKKIILTTDQDLIKDGVQAIDDEFLEWFVKNPSCESVEVNSIETNPDYKSNWENRFTYKIIIQKEEPKQETTLDEAAEKYAKMMWGVYYDDIHPDIAITQTQGEITVKDFIAGAKWMRDKLTKTKEK